MFVVVVLGTHFICLAEAWTRPPSIRLWNDGDSISWIPTNKTCSFLDSPLKVKNFSYNPPSSLLNRKGQDRRLTFVKYPHLRFLLQNSLYRLLQGVSLTKSVDDDDVLYYFKTEISPSYVFWLSYNGIYIGSV